MRRRLALIATTSLGLVPLVAAACTTIGSLGELGIGTGGAIVFTATTVSTTTAGGGGTGGTGFGTPPVVDKVDLLLGIDNTRAMADKQQILSFVLADLIQGLVNPACLDATGLPVSNQPLSGLAACPAGSTRPFAPIDDLHFGVITSSLGGHGADSCSGVDTSTCPGGATNSSIDDRGHLVTRTNPCGGATVLSYQGEGFLAWDPAQSDVPPGQSDLTNLTMGGDELVPGAGEIGCAFGSQLESWYRFLVEPAPYLSIGVVGGAAVQSGVDQSLLAQRGDFLRPDSLLAILMLSDEDDCSIKEYGDNYLAAQVLDPTSGLPFRLPRARAECATNPSDACCRPCNQDSTGCPDDATCVASPLLDDTSDAVSLRCWDEKRRFGVDFLYPTDRYVTGLTSTTVANQAGSLLPNPLYASADGGTSAGARDPTLVFLAGIIGVPWQDLARNPADLTLGYKSAAELALVSSGISTWDVVLGDPAAYVAPLDPHMIESTSPRSGTDPLTGVTLAPATAASGADAINGHEYTQSLPTDLEYACIFPLLTPRDCTDTSLQSCDCTDPNNDNPLCDPDPKKNGQRTLQARAKAYPSLRQLQVLHDLGGQGVTASICPAQLLVDATRSDYAYRPAILALLDRISARLQQP